MYDTSTLSVLAQARGAALPGGERDYGVNEFDNRANALRETPTATSIVEAIELGMDPEDPESVRMAHISLDALL